jgi:hypothetical protein
MNLVFVLIVVAILGLAFWLQKHGDSGHHADVRTAVELAEKSETSPQPSSAPVGQASEHSYMKRAIDRARDVAEHERARTQQAQEP